MIRRLFIIMLLSIPLAGAASTGTSVIVLLIMGGLIFFAFTVVSDRREAPAQPQQPQAKPQ